MLNEIRDDLQKRIQHIKTVLGEEDASDNTESDLNEDLGLEEAVFSNNDEKSNLINSVKGKRKSKKSLKNQEINEKKDKTIKMLHMTNKTPMWNEQSQVYQVFFIS